MSLSDFKLNYKSTSPFSDQLASFIRNEIWIGNLKSGDKMPTMRDAAGLFHVGVATVNKAYQNLMEENLLESRGRQGVYVQENSRQKKYNVSNSNLNCNLWTDVKAANDEILDLLYPVIFFCKQHNISLQHLIRILISYFDSIS